MRKVTTAFVALAAGLFAMHGAVAQQAQQSESVEGTQVTGTVTEVDEDTQEITIDGKTFKVPEQSGTALMPAVGDKVTLFYEEQGDQNLVTRIGQPQ